jgi:hypothetical protein
MPDYGICLSAIAFAPRFLYVAELRRAAATRLLGFSGAPRTGRLHWRLVIHRADAMIVQRVRP